MTASTPSISTGIWPFRPNKASVMLVLSVSLLFCLPCTCFSDSSATAAISSPLPTLDQVEEAVSVLESIGATGYCHESSIYADIGIPPCHTIEAGHEKDKWFYLQNGLLAATCVVVAALAAGLTMGLLSMDPLLLHIKIRAASSEQEKRQASRLLPIVKQHHLLLVSLLLLNSIANEALPLFLDSLVGSYLAVVLSVTLVLFFGEIIPSALFTGPNQMAIAARLTPFVRIVMTLLFPIAYPIAKLLDLLLHDDSDGAYNRGELSALVRIQYEERLATKQRRKLERSEAALKRNGVDEPVTRDENENDKRLSSIHVDEVSMVEGALTMKTKTAVDVYTPLHSVFAVPSDMILTERNMVKIYSSGHSRIPVYLRQEKKPKDITHVLGVLISKQLIVVNESDARCVSTLPLYKPYCVSPYENLVALLNKFQTGGTLIGGHMAMVCTRPELATAALDIDEPIPKSAGFLGIITLEDVLEELIQEEIYDESDTLEQKQDRIARWAWGKWKQFVRRQKRMRGDQDGVRFVDVMERAMAQEGMDFDDAQEEMPLNSADGLNYGGLV